MGDLLKNIALGIRKHTLISTTLAATMLAGFWIAAWLLVFLASLVLIKDTSTGLFGLFIAMWLSTCVEAFIRWVENHRITAQFSKPNENPAFGDNEDYSLLKASFFVMTGIAVTFVFGLFVERGWMDIPSIAFESIPKDGNLKNSFDLWLNSLLEPATITVILSCFLLRIFIYKRSGKIRSPKEK